MWPVMLVAVGSAIGGAARLLLGTFIQTRAGTLFPLGTLVINVVGSFVLGFVARAGTDTLALSPETRLFVTTGICGGFTTFSTFSLDAIRLVEEGEYGRAWWYVALSVAVSLTATLAGIVLARSLMPARR